MSKAKQPAVAAETPDALTVLKEMVETFGSDDGKGPIAIIERATAAIAAEEERREAEAKKSGNRAEGLIQMAKRIDVVHGGIRGETLAGILVRNYFEVPLPTQGVLTLTIPGDRKLRIGPTEYVDVIYEVECEIEDGEAS